MAHRFRLVAAALAGFAFCAPAAAFYVSPTPPPGFAGSPGAWTFAPPTGAQQLDTIIRQSGSAGLRVPTGGSPVSVPVGYRLKAQAARVAAAAIFAHPYVRIGVGIAAWLGVAKVVWDAGQNAWREEQPAGTGHEYYYNSAGGGHWVGSPSAACSGEATYMNTQSSGSAYTYAFDGVVGSAGNYTCKIRQTHKEDSSITGVIELPIGSRPSNSQGCPPGWTESPAGCLSPALDQPSFIEKLAPEGQPQTMPQTVPGELPAGTPLPVEQPLFNPSPGANPNSRPLFVPTGDPVPNPQYDPLAPPSPTNQPWMQPGVRLVPSPTGTEPWRVDVQPVNRPTDSPDPVPEPQPEDDPNNTDKPKPEEQQSLCEKHPDIVACAKIGTLEATPVPNQDKQLAITPDTGYGPGSGTCPAPKTATVMGQPLAFKYDLLCDFAGYIKPIVIAFAWLSAALTFFGFSRKDS